jgi:hypothetical protein
VSFHPRLRELKTTFRSQTWTLGNLLIPLTAMEYFVAFGRVDIRKRRALHGTAAECGGAQRLTAAPARHGQVTYRYVCLRYHPLCFLLRYVLLHSKASLLFLAPLQISSCVLFHANSPCAPGQTGGLFAEGSSARLRVSHPCQT